MIRGEVLRRGFGAAPGPSMLDGYVIGGTWSSAGVSGISVRRASSHGMPEAAPPARPWVDARCQAGERVFFTQTGQSSTGGGPMTPVYALASSADPSVIQILTTRVVVGSHAMAEMACAVAPAPSPGPPQGSGPTPVAPSNLRMAMILGTLGLVGAAAIYYFVTHKD